METTTTKSVIIGAKPDQVFQACAEPESLSRRLRHIRSVEDTGKRTSRWVANAPDGDTIAWETELTRVEPEQRIAWAATSESEIKTSGQVTFNAMPHDQTELTLILKVVAPDGTGQGDPSSKLDDLVDENLRALKSSIENTES